MAAEPSIGVIEGKLINGTEGGGSMAGQQVSLKTFLDDEELPGLATTTAADDGTFRFEGLETDDLYSYEVSSTYQAIEYTYTYVVDSTSQVIEYSQRISFEADGTTKPIEITVYDTTDSDTAIKIENYQILIYELDGLRWVTEQINFANEGDRVYTGSEEISEGKKAVLRISLPEGATELVPIDGITESSMSYTDDGFADTQSFSPGNKTLIFEYQIQDTAEEFTFSKTFHYPTSIFHLYVQGSGLIVSGAGLTAEDPLNISDFTFAHASASDLGRDSVVEAHICPKSSSSLWWVWLAAGLPVFACILGLGYLIVRRRAHPQVFSPENDLEFRKERLLQEIAQLDDEFEEGTLSSEMYEEMRSEKKRQLENLISQADR